MKFAIFSGRFDPCHLGHVQSIIKIAYKYNHVLVPILDYEDRFIPAKIVKETFESLFNSMSPLNNVTFIVNDIHFGYITEEQYNFYIKMHFGIAADVTYLSGNPEVLAHFKQLGLKHEFFERSMDDIYTGTGIRKEIIDNGYI